MLSLPELTKAMLYVVATIEEAGKIIAAQQACQGVSGADSVGICLNIIKV